MSNIYTDCANAAIAAATALEFTEGVALFKTVEFWNSQFDASVGGMSSFDRLAPFFFIEPAADGGRRAGDGDLNAPVNLNIMIGQSMTGRSDNVKVGDAYNPGIFDMLEKVMQTFDIWHPNSVDGFSGITVDEFRYQASYEQADEKCKRALYQITFTSNYIVPRS